MIKPLLVNTDDIRGGAARAAYRLYQGLDSIGVESSMLVQRKTGEDFTVISPQTKLEKGWAKARPIISKIALQLYRQRESVPYSTQWLPERIAAKVARINPDIINLHWICDGYVQIETLSQLNKPLVWTLHDMWAFTGGCHYSGKCDRYSKSCGACPQLHSNRDRDISRWVWQRKAKAWQNLNLTIVTPSHWLANSATASSLLENFPVKVIPNGIDITKYQPVASNLARKLMSLPQDKQLVLFGAMSATSDRRKGFYLLQPALQYLSQSGWQEKLEVVVFGASEPVNPPNLGFKCHYLGKLSDDVALTLAYNAADVMVVPSIQDNLPNTIMEAIACGTPCVAFNTGGIPDLIEHQQNGYLAVPFESEDLARGIAWMLEDNKRYARLSDRAREKAEQEFALDIQAHRYLGLFEELVNQEVHQEVKSDR